MHPAVEKAIEEIDAAIFSGDTFLNLKENRKLCKMLHRWQKALMEHELIINDVHLGFIDDGQRAYRLNKSINECPDFSNPEHRDLWKVGWHSARDGVSKSVAFSTHRKEQNNS